MKLYDELAPWFHLLTAPESYAEEAATYSRLIESRARRPVEEVLELGAGGGNNASHMKSRFKMTLTDVSRPMLEVSRGLNPECGHFEGDMRTLRLGRQFDAVFVQDAVMYMTSEEDLRAAMATAVEHCRPGGVVLFAPDCVRETFHPYTHDGGHDGDDGRALRYNEETSDPDPEDSTYRVELAYRLRERDGTLKTDAEVHIFGLFAEAEWVEWLTAAGLEVEAIASMLGEPEAPPSVIFVGVKPGGAGG